MISSCPPFSHYQVLIHIDVVFNSSPNLFFVTLICMVKSVLTSLIYVCMQAKFSYNYSDIRTCPLHRESHNFVCVFACAGWLSAQPPVAMGTVPSHGHAPIPQILHAHPGNQLFNQWFRYFSAVIT